MLNKGIQVEKYCWGGIEGFPCILFSEKQKPALDLAKLGK